jgi:hypothetical protein
MQDSLMVRSLPYIRGFTTVYMHTKGPIPLPTTTSMSIFPTPTTAASMEVPSPNYVVHIALLWLVSFALMMWAIMALRREDRKLAQLRAEMERQASSKQQFDRLCANVASQAQTLELHRLKYNGLTRAVRALRGKRLPRIIEEDESEGGEASSEWIEPHVARRH